MLHVSQSECIIQHSFDLSHVYDRSQVYVDYLGEENRWNNYPTHRQT